MPTDDDRLDHLEHRVDQLTRRLADLELQTGGAGSVDSLPPGIHPPGQEFSWTRRR